MSAEPLSHRPIVSCTICTEPYDEMNRRPIAFPCMHTFCAICVTAVRRGGNPLCPTCRSNIMRGNIQFNFGLEEALRQMGQFGLRSVAASRRPSMEGEAAPSLPPLLAEALRGSLERFSGANRGDAIQELHQILARRSGDECERALACFYLGLVYIQSGQFNESVPYFSQITESLYLDEQRKDLSCYYLGLAYFNLQRRMEAFPLFNKVEYSSYVLADHGAALNYFLGCMRYYRREYELSIDSLSRAKQHGEIDAPFKDKIDCYLGLAFANSERYQEAIECLTQVKDSPHLSSEKKMKLHHSLGIAHARSHQYREAARCFTHVVNNSGNEELKEQAQTELNALPRSCQIL